jgi:hypothetical protein
MSFYNGIEYVPVEMFNGKICMVPKSKRGAFENREYWLNRDDHIRKDIQRRRDEGKLSTAAVFEKHYLNESTQEIAKCNRRIGRAVAYSLEDYQKLVAAR